MAAPRPLLTKKQKEKIGNLMLAQRPVQLPADFEASPTMQAMFQYVNRLIQAERRWWEKKIGLR